jgi:hypothetical protein
MTLLNKILLALLIMTVVSAVGFVIYKERQLNAQQAAIAQSMVEFKRLQDNMARSQSQYVSKDDLNNFAKQNQVNLDIIAKDLQTLNATVTGINAITLNSPGTVQTNVPSTSVKPNQNPPPPPTVDCNGTQIPCPNADPYGYTKNDQHLELDEQFKNGTANDTKVPLADVSFSAGQQNPWNATVYPRVYNITNVLGTDQDGKHYVYNKVIINSNGKDYPVQVSSAKYEEEYPSASFSLWNPRLFIGVDGGVGLSKLPVSGEFTPSIGVGIMSYGTSKVSPDWSFVQVGVGYGAVSRSAQLEISPAQYNIGKHIPLMTNAYIGPTMGIGADGNVSVGAGLRVGL